MNRKDAWDTAEAELEEWNRRGSTGTGRRVGPVELFRMQMRLAEFLHHDAAQGDAP